MGDGLHANSYYCAKHNYEHESEECPYCLAKKKELEEQYKCLEKLVDEKTKQLLENPKAAFGNKKIPAGTVSQLVMMEVAVGMLEGARKYGRHNYRNNEGIIASVYYEATRRHLDFWWEGEDIDPDSQLSHITKAIASLMVLRDAMIVGTFVDDRPPKITDIVAFRERLEKVIEEIKNKIPEPVEPVTELNKRG